MITRLFRFLLGKKTAADIGHHVPSNLKFGVLVAIALFWADFLRVLFSDLVLYFAGERSPLLTNFLIAVVATLIGISALEGYRRIRKWFEQIEVK